MIEVMQQLVKYFALIVDKIHQIIKAKHICFCENFILWNILSELNSMETTTQCDFLILLDITSNIFWMDYFFENFTSALIVKDAKMFLFFYEITLSQC